MENSIELRVKEIIAEQLDIPIERVTNEAEISAQLGGDSLDAVEIVEALEEEFELDISDDDTELLITVGDIIKYVEQRQ